LVLLIRGTPRRCIQRKRSNSITPSSDSADLAVLQGRPQVHAIYVHPARTTSRFPTYAAMFQADVRQASALVKTLGRDIRWDLRPAGASAACDGDLRATMLDITVFRSRYSAGQLSGGDQFSLVANELAASKKFSAVNKKYVVWLDAASQTAVRGPSTRTPAASRTTTARSAAPRGLCTGRTPPPTTKAASAGVARCSTNSATTWVRSSSKPTTDPLNDGYPSALPERLGWGTSISPWWAVNLSKYICPPGAQPDCAISKSNPGY
jgi:hypothetical protein